MSRTKQPFKQNKDTTPSASHEDMENMKRIHLLFDRITSLLLSERELQNIPIEVLSAAKIKAKDGKYFVKSAVKGHKTVDWESIEHDIRVGFISALPNDDMVNENYRLPEKVQDEIQYEIDRQNAETVQVMTQVKMKSLADRNTMPMMQRWRKEAYPPRQYEAISQYVPAECISADDAKMLTDQLYTSLNGYLGPAYNYDDNNLTEEWMISYQDLYTKPSDDDVIRTQVESILDIMMGQIQDKICNDGAVYNIPPVGLGERLIERPVWGIDCYTRKMLELILQDHCPEEYTAAKFKYYVEKMLLPAINATPTSCSHRFIDALTSLSHRETAYTHVILDHMLEYLSRDQWRVHPKGTGVICVDPNGIPPNVIIADYLGEMYPPYRWCEKLDIVQKAQDMFGLKPMLPDFYNILLERPKRDTAGYGLIYVDASRKANLGSSCSHSCDANCTSSVIARDNKLTIVLTTNRHVSYGEELCMDYYSITTSEAEWRAAICLCGTLSCRGSFLHYATQDDLQQVLFSNFGSLVRMSSLLRANSAKSLTEEDKAILAKHGISSCIMGHNPPLWMMKYIVDNLKFVEFERKALPCALLRKDRTTGTMVYNYSGADLDARSVMEQRLQSIVCCYSMILKFLSQQPLENRSKFPLQKVSTAEAVNAIWDMLKTIPKLICKFMINNGKRNRDVENGVMAIEQILDEAPTGLMSLREKIANIRGVISELECHSTPTARLMLLADMLCLWGNTSNFIRISAYNTVLSEPVNVFVRELGTNITRSMIKMKAKPTNRPRSRPSTGRACKDIASSDAVLENNKVNPEINESISDSTLSMDVTHDDALSPEVSASLEESNTTEESVSPVSMSVDGENCLSENNGNTKANGHTGAGTKKKTPPVLDPNDVIFSSSKEYNELYVFWQLIDWFNAGTDQSATQSDIFGCAQLPLPASCFGASVNDYTTKERKALCEHLADERKQVMSWPDSIRRCFSSIETVTSETILGSPMLDVNLGQVLAVENVLRDMNYTITKRISIEDMQLDNHLPPELPTDWVQCESCMKWRRVPYDIDVNSLPDTWTCEMNYWNTEQASCSVETDNYDPDRENTLKVAEGNVGEQTFEIGQYKDVYCIRNLIFYEAKIVDIKNGPDGKPDKVKFHFNGWSASHDEWIEVSSNRIVPHHFFTMLNTRNARDQEKYQGVKIPTSYIGKKSSKKRKGGESKGTKKKVKK